jgi:hypothetical protein
VIVDTHLHALPASGDSRMSVDMLADACVAMGVDAVALTDHGPGTDFASVASALEAHGIAFVPGREVDTPLGHVIVLSLETEWLASLPYRLELPLTPPRGPMACIWAHPTGWRVAGAMIPPQPHRGAEHVHGVEVLNGERLYQDGGVAAAVALAEELRAAHCGGSDAHDPAAVGRCLTEAPGASDALSFIEAVIAGEVRPVLSRRWATANGMEYRRGDLIGYVR